MRIVQLLPTMAMGDAIGNDVLALSTVIRNMGFQTGIYAETVDRRLPEGTAFPWKKCPVCPVRMSSSITNPPAQT